MKKQVIALALTAAMALPMAAVASADNATVDTSTNAATTISSAPVEIEPGVYDLGKHANDDLFPLSPLTTVKWKDTSSLLNNGIVTPMATDGQNINYSFLRLTSYIVSSPLPAHRYGTIQVVLTQDGNPSYPAKMTYQWVSADNTLTSSVILVTGNYTSTNKTITFSGVPKGTASNPMQLIIRNITGNDAGGNVVATTGNGYTL